MFDILGIQSWLVYLRMSLVPQTRSEIPLDGLRIENPSPINKTLIDNNMQSPITSIGADDSNSTETEALRSTLRFSCGIGWNKRCVSGINRNHVHRAIAGLWIDIYIDRFGRIDSGLEDVKAFHQVCAFMKSVGMIGNAVPAYRKT